MIRASVSVSYGSGATASFSVVTAGATYVKPVWSVNYVLPVVDVSYVLITFDAATDDLGRYRRFRDAFVVSEALANHLNKARSDTAEAAESYSVGVGKSSNDSPAAEDLFDRVVSYVRGFLDAAGASEAYASGFGKLSTDEASIGDSDPVRLFGKNVLDAVGATDDLDGAASILDDQEMFFFKATNNVATASELFDRTVVFSREFSDSYTAGDLYAGHLFKPQTDGSEAFDVFFKQVTFSRSPTDTAETSESLSKDMYVRIGDDTEQDYVQVGYFFEDYVEGDSTEILDVEDLTTILTGKAFSSESQGSDSFSRTVEYSRTFADAVGATDDLDGAASTLDDQEMAFFKSRSLVARAAETLAYSLNRGFADGYTASEAYSASFAKPLSDGSEAADSYSLLFSSVLANALEAAESQTTAFSKALSDTPIFSDSFVQSLGKVRSDSATSSDSGSLVSQGYVDNVGYFAEDYVGASRSF